MGAQNIWADALKESESPEARDAGLWAKCFAEADGDEAKAKAAYIKAKVAVANPPAAAPAPQTRQDRGWCPVCHEPLDMDALYCAACKSNLSARNLSPLRYRPTTTSQAPAEERKKSNWWKWALGVPVGGFALVMIVGSCAANTPDGKERSNSRLAIELCWKEQSRKSLDPSAARFAASACEKMESDYRNRWGTNP